MISVWFNTISKIFVCVRAFTTIRYAFRNTFPRSAWLNNNTDATYRMAEYLLNYGLRLPSDINHLSTFSIQMVYAFQETYTIRVTKPFPLPKVRKWFMSPISHERCKSFVGICNQSPNGLHRYIEMRDVEHLYSPRIFTFSNWIYQFLRSNNNIDTRILFISS